MERFDKIKWIFENEDKEIAERDMVLTEEMLTEIRKNMKQLMAQYKNVQASLHNTCKDEAIKAKKIEDEILNKLDGIKKQLAIERSAPQRKALLERQQSEEKRLSEARRKYDLQRQESLAMQLKYAEWCEIREREWNNFFATNHSFRKQN